MARTRRRQRKISTEASGGGELEPIQVPAVWTNVEDAPIFFANHIFVSLVEGQYLVTFGRSHTPYKLSWGDEELEQLKQRGIEIRPVVRLALSPSKIEPMIKAMRTILDRMQGQGSETEDEKAGS